MTEGSFVSQEKPTSPQMHFYQQSKQITTNMRDKVMGMLQSRNSLKKGKKSSQRKGKNIPPSGKSRNKAQDYKMFTFSANSPIGNKGSFKQGYNSKYSIHLKA